MAGLLEIGVALTVVALSIVVFFKSRFKYWERKNAPYIKPSMPWGTSENLLNPKRSLMVSMAESYNQLKSAGHKFGGLYLMTKPALLVVDPELVKKVISKDFQYFTGHGMHVDEEKRPLSGNLFSLDGEKWKNMRVKLTPTFTSGKMKMMFGGIVTCGEPMVDHVDRLSKEGEPLNIKEIMACFTTDVIGSTAFGIECNSFKEPDAEFRKYGRKIFEPSRKANIRRTIDVIIPWLRLRAATTPTADFFKNSFENIVKHREETNFMRNDFVQLLLEVNRKAEAIGSDDKLTIGQMAAQSFMFFAAGFETSSTTMTFCLHELAHHPVIQERLRKEIIETMEKHEGALTYEAIMEMKYLNMVLDETLRKYPPAPGINRVCNKDYKIEGSDVVIESGTFVFVSILGLHRDPEYFPDPDKFDPDRFSDENKSMIQSYTYLPFGEGPRICIGLRFGVMQAKVGLCLLLKNFRFTPHESMSYNMRFHVGSQILSWEKDLLLRAEKIK